MTEIQLIDANGELRTFNSEDQLKAVRASLGLFGVIVEFTIKLQPNFKVKIKNYYPKIREFTAEKLKEKLNDPKIFSVQVYWYPYNSISFDGIKHSLQGKPVQKHEWDADDDKLWVREVHYSEAKYGIAKVYAYI